jgi:D-arginine dehydrogenase
VIVGAGFAGASTAWALGRAGLGPGVILERESTFGFHASGRNAALLYLVESSPFLLSLALRSLGHIERLDVGPDRLVRYTGGLTLGAADQHGDFESLRARFRDAGLITEVLSEADTHERFPLTRAVGFGSALWCAREGVVDIHALLTLFLHKARESGFTLRTNCPAEELIVEGGRVVGVRTNRGDVRADVVVDASGAWAGRLGRGGSPLPLRPMRRHLFVTGAPAGGHLDSPFVWDEQVSFYFRPEGDGLLFSPCDETPMEPCEPPLDDEAVQMLARKLADKAPSFSDLPVRRSWACLRTFAPDRRPMIGPDPGIAGLFHVSALGGYGMTTSAAVGELAATLLAGNSPDWIDPSPASPARQLQW